MKPRTRILATLVIAVALLLTCGIAPLRAETTDLLIMHTNDVHGNMQPQVNKKLAAPPATVGGAAYFATMVKKEREANPGKMLLLDAGDIAQGTPISNFFQGLPMVRVMSAIGYDATVLGNHEFDWGQKALARMVAAARYPVLSANVVYEKNGRPIVGVRPYIIRNVSGMKVAIIGLTAPETPGISFKANVDGLAFLPPEEICRRTMEEISVKHPGLNFFIVLSHLGVGDDEKLAKEVPGIDVIVGGHTHAKLTDPKKVGDTIIVQAGSYLLYYGLLRLKVDTDTGKVTAYTEKDELVTLFDKDITPDPEVSRIISLYATQVEPIMGKVVGTASEDIRSRDNLPGHIDSPLGNLLCDAFREATGADVALYNGGGIRADFQKGNVTVGDIYKVLPFDNSLCTAELPGKKLAKVLEEAADHSYYVLQVSGITCDVNMKAPAGSRVTNILVNGAPIEPEKSYKIATIDFLYFGGDKLKSLQEGTNLTMLKFSRDIFQEYVEKASPIEGKKDLRIRESKN